MKATKGCSAPCPSGERASASTYGDLGSSLGARLVTYADDLVILCRRGKGEQALLTVNEEKTRICKAPEREFDFLGYTFGRMFSARTGQCRFGYRPSNKSIERVVEKVHALTGRSCLWQETTTLVGKLNRMLRGWANYFSVGASARRIGRLTPTRRRGCAGGCVSSTKLGGAGAIHSRISTGTSGSYV